MIKYQRKDEATFFFSYINLELNLNEAMISERVCGDVALDTMWQIEYPIEVGRNRVHVMSHAADWNAEAQ